MEASATLPQYPLDRRLFAIQSRSEHCTKEEHVPLMEIKSSVLHNEYWSTYLLSYTGLQLNTIY